MAQRNTDLNINISATDKASPTIERLEKKIDGLESDEARIIVTAQTDKLEAQLKSAKAKLDGLDGDEATVQARLIGNLETQLDEAQTLFRKLDGQTGTVHINAVDNASDDLDRIDNKLDAIDGRTARAHVEVTGDTGGGEGVDLVGLGKTGLGVAAGAGVAGELLTTSQLAIQVQAIADATGATHEEASKLVAMWTSNGQEAGDLLDLLLQVNQTMQQDPELAEKLGVKIKSNQSLIETFLQAVEGIGTAYDTNGERAVAMSQVLGEEGVKQVSYVKGAVIDLRQAIEDTPPITHEEDLTRARELNRLSGETRNNYEIAKQKAASILVPGINTTLTTADPNRGMLASAMAAWHLMFGDTGFGDLLGTSGGAAREQQVVRENTAGFFGGAFGAIQVADRTGRGGVTIINSYGTAANTVDANRIYQRRNGSGAAQ